MYSIVCVGTCGMENFVDGLNVMMTVLVCDDCFECDDDLWYI